MYNSKTWETFASGTIIDSKTGDILEKRKDDNEAGILKRIEEFVNKTLPIVAEQKAEWKVIEINADQSVNDVFADLENKLKLL
jgi:adenylate kinase